MVRRQDFSIFEQLLNFWQLSSGTAFQWLCKQAAFQRCWAPAAPSGAVTFPGSVKQTIQPHSCAEERQFMGSPKRAEHGGIWCLNTCTESCSCLEQGGDTRSSSLAFGSEQMGEF